MNQGCHQLVQFFHFSDNQGNNFQAVVVEVTPEVVVADLNHLNGWKNFIFRCEIVDHREATEEERMDMHTE